MQQSLYFRSSLQHPFFFKFNPVQETPLHFSTNTLQSKIKQSPLLLRSSNLRNTIVCARRNRRRRRTSLRISTKTAIDCALFVAANLKLLPEPVNLILKEGFGDGSGSGGGGGGLGNWNGFGFGRGGFDGWGGKKGMKKLGIFVVGLIGVVLFLVVMLGKDFAGWRDLGSGVVGLIGLIVLERDWKRGIKGWTFGFCFCALMVFLGCRRDDLTQRTKGFRVHSTALDVVRRSGGRLRRAM